MGQTIAVSFSAVHALGQHFADLNADQIRVFQKVCIYITPHRRVSNSDRPNMPDVCSTSPTWAARGYLCASSSRRFYPEVWPAQASWSSLASPRYGRYPASSSRHSHAAYPTRGNSTSARGVSISSPGLTTSASRTSLLKYY
jgi:hypothetical protein